MIAGALAVAACSATTPDFVRIDGWPIEGEVDCAALAGRGGPGCERIVEIARQDMARAQPELAAVEPVLYDLDTVDERRRVVHMARSGGGGEYVVVFEASGSRHIVGVWCGAGVEPNVCGTYEKPDY